MINMEVAADKLETMFKQADANIDLLSRKLDIEFLKSEEEKKGANPKEMLQQLSEIKKEFASVVKEAQAIKQAQEEAMQFFKSELQGMCATLSQLQMTSGMQVAEKSEELKQLNEVLGIAPAAAAEEIANGDTGAEGDADTDESVTTHIEESEELSASERRCDTDDFLPLTEDEFNTVSDLTRGRAKLSEVNQTYQLIWRHFKEEGNSKPLTSQEMFKMGLRVTGQTGEAKLKILRSLKLLKIAKNGSILLT